MDARRGTRLLPLAAACALVAAAVSACTPIDLDADPTGSTSPTPSTSASSATPTPQATLTMPDTTDPDQIGSVVFDATGQVPSSSVVAGPAALDDPVVTVRGECVGGSLSFELRTAAVGEDQRRILRGRMQCGTPWQNVLDGNTYSGPVQFVITDSEDVSQGWFQAFGGEIG